MAQGVSSHTDLAYSPQAQDSKIPWLPTTTSSTSQDQERYLLPDVPWHLPLVDPELLGDPVLSHPPPALLPYHPQKASPPLTHLQSDRAALSSRGPASGASPVAVLTSPKGLFRPGRDTRRSPESRQSVTWGAKMSWLLTGYASPAPCPSDPGDRFIPSRTGSDWSLKFQRAEDAEKSPRQTGEPGGGDTLGTSREIPVYSALLKNELLGAGIERVQYAWRGGQWLLQPGTPAKQDLFVYSPGPKGRGPDAAGSEASQFALSSISPQSQALLRLQKKPSRKVPPKPFKILRAPELQNNFCLNLLDWSPLNIVSVALGSRAFLWNAVTYQVTRLCDLAVEGDSVTSTCWSREGNLLAVGTHNGFVQIWDVAAEKKVSVLDGHRSRVGVLAWNQEQISSGSRDATIIQRDFRTPALQSERQLHGHSREVCGLQWSTNGRLLASSGRDNTILLWNRSSLHPVQQYTRHKGAVRAIAWSPHQQGLLASGGAATDRSIHFWNTLTEQTLHIIHTGSQVCNLAWSRHSNELVSTHGSPENQVAMWKYPSLTQVAKLTGHTCRVLYLTTSPDGQVIATGAADGTLRFWDVFVKPRPRRPSPSVLDLFSHVR
ncbi:fizzy-related protein homolog [Dromiciops gliroides]|uniref:fizzy-related protein homolog n=1 Tax=Dromiciops gliroides TaxID=33562 RepID=UPI001CC42C0C|nr:fizzy-related protein homolog [Dromiciops gliroides]